MEIREQTLIEAEVRLFTKMAGLSLPAEEISHLAQSYELFRALIERVHNPSRGYAQDLALSFDPTAQREARVNES